MSSRALLRQSFVREAAGHRAASADRRGRKPSPVRRVPLRVTLPPALVARVEAEAVRRFGAKHHAGTGYGKRSDTIEQLIEEALSRRASTR